tara:strand:+ start:600 stop:1325 length:726 start_codon:yes stop_codon:yes gene_type:complete
MKKYLLALLLVLPSIAFSSNLDNFYITAKGGISNTSNTGTANYTQYDGGFIILQNEDLGAGTAFGFSVGKYLTDSFRFELEAIKRTGYEYDALYTDFPRLADKAKIQTEALFINGFYDFQPFTIGNTAITPYLGGGVSISRNKMETTNQHLDGLPTSATLGIQPTIDGNTINKFAYKLSVGTLVSLTEQLSLDVNYQYVNLGEFKGGVKAYNDGVYQGDNLGAVNGDIKTQELMVGLQYKF